MENLEFGWMRSSRSNTYHYIRNFSEKSDYDNVSSLCNKKIIEIGYAKTKSFLEEYEISIQYHICTVCKIHLEQLNQNHLKKEILNDINELSIHDNHVLKNVICSEDGCKVSGVAFVSVFQEEKPHYCITHNLRVQLNCQKEKELVMYG